MIAELDQSTLGFLRHPCKTGENWECSNIEIDNGDYWSYWVSWFSPCTRHNGRLRWLRYDLVFNWLVFRVPSSFFTADRWIRSYSTNSNVISNRMSTAETIMEYLSIDWLSIDLWSLISPSYSSWSLPGKPDRQQYSMQNSQRNTTRKDTRESWWSAFIEYRSIDRKGIRWNFGKIKDYLTSLVGAWCRAKFGIETRTTAEIVEKRWQTIFCDSSWRLQWNCWFSMRNCDKRKKGVETNPAPSPFFSLNRRIK